MSNPFNLYDHQVKALAQMHNGCILCGGTGSGKSRTAIAYYLQDCSGPTRPLYIITTARKRDSNEWNGDITPFDVPIEVVVDSWNNIKHYENVQDAFFIFDEQRVVGSGAWVKAFWKIADKNRWILLTATPGDCWNDYAPVFIANKFYKNLTDFRNQHIVYSRFSSYPRIDRYLGTGKLAKIRDMILVNMDCDRETTQHHEDVLIDYDHITYKDVMKNRWNPYTNKPIKTASELCYTLRKITNSDESRQVAILELFEKHPRMIVFYNFDYELDILKSIQFGPNVTVAEWNGHAHEPVPETLSWVYLVQYSAGCEAWNCITTDTIVFFSQNYSYKVMIQAAGRIDRINTKFRDLYYYHLKSLAPIDRAISIALKQKKTFNESKYAIGKFFKD